MHVVAVASQKGGSGKTTLAGHLAVQAEMTGAGPVAVVDTDPQASLADWWNERTESTPVFMRTTVANLDADLKRLQDHGINLVIIDTPPAITNTITEVVQVADLVVVPTRPSPHDLRAVGLSVDLIEGLNKPLVFVVNGATLRAKVTSEVAIALSQHGTVSPSIIHQRVGFATSMTDGRTVMEIQGQKRASEEIAELWTYLEERLNKTFGKKVRLPFGEILTAASRAFGYGQARA
ncbi:MAG: AAA family ATPase [Rhodospirillaceae bacterium]|nr:AAA family ATPase [Rhodospirillaceae bacterium]MDD9924629.1 AAA family ATPase [Rhodospirillaceae bacterium]